MIHYPEAQAAAQAEIDRVVGNDRLPTYHDRDSLPYVEALYKEVLRWQSVAPFAVPHRLDWKKDDEYRGELLIKQIYAACLGYMRRNENTQRLRSHSKRLGNGTRSRGIPKS